MDKEDKFFVASWWATSPEFVLQSLQSQLEAASAIWPELKDYVVPTRMTLKKKYAGEAGGHARAAALSPEERSATATKAANARWQSRKPNALTIAALEEGENPPMTAPKE